MVALKLRTQIDMATYQDFEFLLINDNSTDSSLDICNSYKDERMKIVTKPQNHGKGLASSRNFGINMAKGQYVLMQDADDSCASDRLEKQLSIALGDANKRIVGCWINKIFDGRVKLGWSRLFCGKVRVIRFPVNHDSIIAGFRRHFNRNVLAPQTLLFPRWILTKYPYNPKFKYMQDYDQLYRIYESNSIRFFNCPKPLYNHFIRAKGVKSNPEWIDYNFFVRHCRFRRIHGLNEHSSLSEFQDYLKNNNEWDLLFRLFKLSMKVKLFFYG